MNNDIWERSDCLSEEGFPYLLWETLQLLGYTEPPVYYICEYDDTGAQRCEVRLHIKGHPHCPEIKAQQYSWIGRRRWDTTQKLARIALADYCGIFEEDIHHTPAKYFPVPNQTTPTWHDKVRELEQINRETPAYTKVLTIRYLHNLDNLFEDQQKELAAWIDRQKRTRAELNKRTIRMSHAIHQVKQELEQCQQELRRTQRQLHKKRRTRQTQPGGRTFARQPIAPGSRNGVPAYDPQRPYYDLNGYVPRESMTDNETVQTKESVADNSPQEAGPSRLP